jgi:hypothetical protein
MGMDIGSLRDKILDLGFERILRSIVIAVEFGLFAVFYRARKGLQAMIDVENDEERNFAEFRRKIRSAEMLSSSTIQLMRGLRFTGRLSVVVQNGRVLKSGYEEGYFRQGVPESNRQAQ